VTRPVLVDNAGSYDAAELAARVAGVTAALRGSGISPGSTVLLVAGNRCEPAVSYLAAVGLGARVVLVDRRAGESDLRGAISATSPDLVVSDPNLLAQQGISATEASTATPGSEVIVFTSGTSSRPKAVVHTMPSLLAGVRNMAHLLSFGSGDAAFLVSPLASITGVMQLHLALEYGGRLVLEDAFSPADSLRRLIENGVTVFGGAPFVLEELLAEAARQAVPALPLRAVAVGGTAIPRRLLEDAAARYGIVPTRVYGSSECPNAFGSDPQDPLPQRLADEGVPMQGTEGRIDPVTGELQLRGDNLFSGYLDPADNVEAFTADGWLRTGDQATFEHGRLRITGRIKEIVARKGMKISLAEIDEFLIGLPGCIAAAAYGVSDARTGERVAVAVQTEPHVHVTLDDVTAWLSAAGLATYKLPEELVVWHEPLPRTASGKVIRRALAAGQNS
jgi:acyl-CoA synthetase (AMP-forming)/AMP-acid ligase II